MFIKFVVVDDNGFFGMQMYDIGSVSLQKAGDGFWDLKFHTKGSLMSIRTVSINEFSLAENSATINNIIEAIVNENLGYDNDGYTLLISIGSKNSGDVEIFEGIVVTVAEKVLYNKFANTEPAEKPKSEEPSTREEGWARIANAIRNNNDVRAVNIAKAIDDLNKAVSEFYK